MAICSLKISEVMQWAFDFLACLHHLPIFCHFLPCVCPSRCDFPSFRSTCIIPGRQVCWTATWRSGFVVLCTTVLGRAPGSLGISPSPSLFLTSLSASAPFPLLIRVFLEIFYDAPIRFYCVPLFPFTYHERTKHLNLCSLYFLF